MSKLKVKMTFLSMVSVLIFGVQITSCSKKDNGEELIQTQGTIDAAVGTYKGKLITYAHSRVDEWYDAVIIVTKESNNQLKVAAQSGEEYSDITPKVFTVETGAFFGTNTQDIVSLTGSLEGILAFYGANKNISIVADKQAETDIEYHFDGVKQ